MSEQNLPEPVEAALTELEGGGWDAAWHEVSTRRIRVMATRGSYGLSTVFCQRPVEAGGAWRNGDVILLRQQAGRKLSPRRIPFLSTADDHTLYAVLRGHVLSAG